MQPQVIDLSHHNTVPKYLHDTAASGIVGVIHKATQGLHSVDMKCAARYALAKDAGLCWGIYHFLEPGNWVSLKDQADFFLAQAHLYDEKTLLALDFEKDGIRADDLLVWLKHIEQETQQRPILYSGSFLKQLHGQERLASYRLWLAQYGSHPVLPNGFKDYFLWQYSDSGTIPGIEGKCDVNVSRMSNDELRQNWIDSAPLSATDIPTISPKGVETPEAPEFTEGTRPPQQALNQTIIDVPQTAPAPAEPDLLTRINTRFTTLGTSAAAAAAAGWAAIKDAAPEIIVSLIVVSGVLLLVWMIMTKIEKISANKQAEETKRQREQQAHALTVLQANSAAQPGLQTVRIVPSPLISSDPAPEG
jgi:lysozyme